LVDECGKSVLFSVYSMTERPNLCVHVSPGSAGTLARGGGLANHHLTVQHHCIKLPKSINVHWSYSVLSFFWDTVYTNK